MAVSSIIKVVALADVARLVGGMKKAGQSVKGFEQSGSSSMKKFAGVAAGAAGAAALIAAALVKATKAAVEDQKSQAILAKSMQNVMGATAGQIAESEAFVQSMQKQVAIADDQLRPAYSTLIRSTGDVAKSQQLLQLATDISAGSGKDLGMVTQALGKAYNGQYASLNKLVPGIAAAEDPMAALQKQFGGMAEAAANNDPFARMKVIFDDLAETVGTVLIPVMNTLLDAIQPLIDTLAPIITELVSKLAPILVAIIEPLADFLGKLMEDLAPVIDIVLELVTILMDLLAPILEIVGVVMEKVAEAVVSLLEPLMPLVEELMPIFITILEILMKVLEPVLGIIVLLAKAIGKGLGKAFKGLMPILDIAMVALEALLDIVTGIVDGAMEALKWLGGVLGIDLSAKAGVGAGVNTTTLEGILAASGKPGTKKKPPTPPGGGGKGNPALEAAKKALEGAIKTLQTKLDEARQLVADTVAKFRDSVDTAFGLVQRGSGMVFRADRYIRELKRMKAATADFNKNLQKLRQMGGDAANPLLEQILSKSPEEAAAIMRSFTASPEMFAEAIKTTGELAATGGMVGNQLNAMAGNQTQAEMLTEMKLLRSDLAAGKNTYNIKATMSAVEIVNQIKAWEKSTGKKVLAG
jgi:hypothetical protein